MSYFKLLGLNAEPFSTSPDPQFFYLSKDHESALVNLLIELRLRRGLSVILGDVGTGKTTLSRKLMQELNARGDFLLRVVFDPCYENELVFMQSLIESFNIRIPRLSGSATILKLRALFERFLLNETFNRGNTVVLVIDEAQKLSATSLEILRVLLNFETNDFKLLQLVLMGQMEFLTRISAMHNLYDRISFKYVLNPLSLDETHQMIRFRLIQAGYQKRYDFFSDEAVARIHEFAKGYPRKITMVCHACVKTAVMRNYPCIDADMVRLVIAMEQRLIPQGGRVALQDSMMKVNLVT